MREQWKSAREKLESFKMQRPGMTAEKEKQNIPGTSALVPSHSKRSLSLQG
jgi:hypothetical protein